MDRELIEALMSNKPKASKTVKPNALIRTENGIEQVVLKSSEFGAFQGKTGSIKRSRKGRTYRQSNGYVKFAPNWEKEVIAYLA
jgi:hypothetical protein